MPARVPGLHQPRARVPEEVPRFRTLLGSVWGQGRSKSGTEAPGAPPRVLLESIWTLGREHLAPSQQSVLCRARAPRQSKRRNFSPQGQSGTGTGPGEAVGCPWGDAPSWAWPRIASRCLPAQLTPRFQDPRQGTSQKQRLPNQLQEMLSKALGVRSPEACFSQTGDEGTLLLLPRPGGAEGMLPSAPNACGAGQH